MAGAASEENPVAINVVAMVDIIFCLCLFFMCSLKFEPIDAKFESWLPLTEGERGPPKPALDKIRVVLSWNAEANRLERVFGQSRPVPATADGDALLRDLIRAEREDSRKAGRTQPPVIIDAGPLVPWKHVVDVMDLARDAGVTAVEFGHGKPF